MNFRALVFSCHVRLHEHFFVMWLNKRTSVVPMSQCYVMKQMVNAIACTIELWTHLGGLLSTQEARVALGYRLVRLLRFFRA